MNIYVKTDSGCFLLSEADARTKTRLSKKALQSLAEKRSAADGGETVNGKETNRYELESVYILSRHRRKGKI